MIIYTVLDIQKIAHRVTTTRKVCTLMADCLEHTNAGKAPVRLAVFDFDGTLIEGNSPVILVKRLAASKELSPLMFAKICFWGLAYKFHLPQNESWVRRKVFSAFEGKPVKAVDEFLSDFYDERIERLFRPKATQAILTRRGDCDVVLLVSATFEPIAKRAMLLHGLDYQISTRMRIASDGTYTAEVDGLPVEGEEKLAAIRRFADNAFGKGNWVLSHAYGDHHSDISLLEAASFPHAVSPGPTLSRYAKSRGWDIFDWSFEPDA